MNDTKVTLTTGVGFILTLDQRNALVGIADALEKEMPFCSNPECRANVPGGGCHIHRLAAMNWVDGYIRRVLNEPATRDETPQFCSKSCDHGSPCILYSDHEPLDRHETQHGCIFYDSTPTTEEGV